MNVRNASLLYVVTNTPSSSFEKKIKDEKKKIWKKIKTTQNETIRNKLCMKKIGYDNMITAQEELYSSFMIPKIHKLCLKYGSEVFRLQREILLVVKPTFDKWDKVAQMFQDKNSEEGLLLNGELLGYPHVPGFHDLRTGRDINIIFRRQRLRVAQSTTENMDKIMTVQITAFKCLPNTKHTFPDIKKIEEAMKDIKIIINKNSWIFEKFVIEDVTLKKIRTIKISKKNKIQ
jgi:hypothetical protein